MNQKAALSYKDAIRRVPLRAWRSLNFRARRYLESKRLPDQKVQLQCQGFIMTIGNPKKTAIARSIYLTGQWEPEVTRFMQTHVSPGMTVLDVGAYFGFFALQLARLTHPLGKVYAFEIDPEILPLLYENIAVNSITNADVVEFGLLDRSESLSLVGQGRLQLDGDHTTKEAVHVVAFDDWRLDKTIAKVDFVKMDIEGAELNALLGMRQTLLQDSPQLLIEVHPQFMENFEHRASELYEFLWSVGYEIFLLDGTTVVEVTDAEHIVCRKVVQG